jgi:hypothetical protein
MPEKPRQGGKLCQQMKEPMECSQGVFLSVLQDGPIAAAEGFSAVARARLVSAAARVHVHAYQAAAPRPPEFVNLKASRTGNLQRPYLSCSVILPNNSNQIFGEVKIVL